MEPFTPKGTRSSWQQDIREVNVRYLQLLQRFAREGAQDTLGGVSPDALEWLREQPSTEIERIAHRSALLCRFSMRPEQLLSALRFSAGDVPAVSAEDSKVTRLPVSEQEPVRAE